MNAGPELFCTIIKVHSSIEDNVLSETFFTNTHCSELTTFTSFHTTRNPLQLQDGISVYVKNLYKACKINHLTNILVTIEVCNVRVEINQDLNVYNIGFFKPPHFSDSTFLHKLRDFLTDCFLPSDKLLFVSDFNIKMVFRYYR